MVESEAAELSEEIMLGAVTHGHREMQPVINAIIELAEACAKKPWEVADAAAPDENVVRIAESFGGDLRAAYAESSKQARVKKLDMIRTRMS
ncbi:uncharacterized protein METZ01_LOCUS298061, partial [marine metagenome]